MENREEINVTELSQEGYQLLREERFEEAQERFERILRVDATNCYALVGMGDLLRHRRRWDEAIGFYRSCIDADESNHYALFGLGESYRAIRKYDAAIDIWEAYLEYDNQNVTVLTRVADAHRKAKNFERSQELYRIVLDIESENPYALIGLGYLHFDFHDYHSAKYYWEKMQTISGADVDIRVLTALGNCHRKLKTFERGIPYFEEALKMEPDNFYALYGLADCYRGMRRPSEAFALWSRVLEKDPKNKVILTRAGDSLRNMRRYEEAEEYYRRALDVDFDLYAVLGLAIIHRLRGECELAAEEIERIIEVDQKNARLYLELSRCYEEKRRYTEALGVLQRAVKSGARNPAIQRRVDEVSARARL